MQKEDLTEAAPQPAIVQAVKNVLDSMNVQQYEPRVLNYLVDFVYNYVMKTLEEAEVYAEGAGRAVGEVALADVVRAMEAQEPDSLAAPPSLDVLLELAEERNRAKLPAVKAAPGLRLPNPELPEMLVAANYQLPRS